MPKQGEYNSSYPDLLLNENKIQLLEDFKGAKQHHKMKCVICNHKWSATPVSKRQTFKKYGVGGCPNCKEIRKENNNKNIRKKNLQKLKERGIEIIDKNYDGRRHLKDHNTYTKIKIRNKNCGHEFYCSPSNLLSRDVECGICGPQKRVEPLTRWSKENSRKWRETASEWKVYKSKVSSLTRENYKKHKNKINPNNLPRGKAGKEGAYHLDHIVPVRFCFENNIPPEVCADPSNLQMLHWNDNVGSRNHIKGSIPPLFLKYIETGTKLQEYANKIKKEAFPCGELFPQISNITVTVYDKQYNHCVVIIPLDKTYANMKTANKTAKVLIQKGINYSIIFEDELANNSQLIINKLKHYSNQNNSQRIHARKCSIQLIDKKQKSQFLNQFHIQGNDTGQINYGAYYNDELVAVMSFCKPRVALGFKDKDRSVYDNIWELSRFATNTNYRIPGIAGKLLKTFQKENDWNQIYSYADRRWSVGNLYERLGFFKEKINHPDYFYVVNGQRKHRWNFRKDMLKNKLPNYDPILTEHQNMVNYGYWRVWDCGTIKYVMDNVE